jgi:hypothetical protein
MIKHAVGVLLIAWRRAFRAGVIAGLVGILLVEIGAIVLTHHFPPSGITQIVAVAMGIALGYAVGATVAADEIIAGIVAAIGLLLGEAEAGVRQAARIAEREVGDVRGAVLRLTGLDTLARKLAPRDALSAAEAPDHARAPAHGRASAISIAEILAAAAAAAPVAAAALRSRGDARTVAPLPRELVNATVDLPAAAQAEPAASPAVPPPAAWAPVTVPLAAPGAVPARADAPHTSSSAQPEPPASPPGLAARPTIPLAAAAAPPAASAVAPASVMPVMPTTPSPLAGAAGLASALPAAPAPVAAAPASGRLAEPAEWQMDDLPPLVDAPWHDPSLGSLEQEREDQEAGIQPVDVFGALPSGAGTPPRESGNSDTRPLPGHTRPHVPTTRPLVPLVPRGGIWEHITNVMAGKQAQPFSLDDDTLPDVPAEEELPPTT